MAAPFRDRFDRPTFIVSTPRSGSSLLFLTLTQARGAYSIGGESHGLIEAIADLHPRRRGWTSNRLAAEDATPDVAEQLARQFYLALRDRDDRRPTGTARMIEKTPKNSLRIPFLRAVFPDANFLYLYRDPRETLSSMIEAWNSGRFRTYPLLPGWQSPPWSLLLVPGWRDLIGRTLPEIVAVQWSVTTDTLLDDLERCAPGRVCALSYADFVARPQEAMNALCATLAFDWDRTLGADLPLSPTVVSSPRADKWRENAEAIEQAWPIVATVDARARAALARYAVPLS